MADYKFPLELDGQIDEALRYNTNRPFMLFSTKDSGVRIYLPIPEGLSFSDSAEYSTLDLGTIGELMDNIDESEGFMGKLKSAAKSSAKSLGAAEIARIAAERVAGGSEIGKAALFATKQILNPNTNTTFTGVGIRSFSFSFKLVGRNQRDSIAIRDIHETFRIYTYPESDDSENNIILDYPEIWTIKFFDTLSGTAENQFIPKIYECYLTGMSTNINSSASMFRTDGAPVEVDFSLNFQETRSLIRQDFTEKDRNARGKLGLQ